MRAISQVSTRIASQRAGSLRPASFKGKLANGTEFDWALEDIPLDSNSIAACGTGLGTGGTIVIDDSVEMIQALSNLNAFYAHETCGQCTPCREGSLWMKKISDRA